VPFPPWYSDPELGKDRSHVLPANRGFDYVEVVPDETTTTTILSSNFADIIQKSTSRIIPFHGSNVYVRRIKGDSNELRGEVEPVYLSYTDCNPDWFQNGTTLCWLGSSHGENNIDYFAVDIATTSNNDNVDVVEEEALKKTLTSADIECSSVRNYGDTMPSRRDAALVAAANGLLTFHRSHGYCAKCGSPTLSIKAGSARKCCNCKTSVYHRIDPAVIMLVSSPCNNYALLGRKKSWPDGRYSTLAGFLEVGETLEDCVVRETLEESGIAVDRSSIRFVASQPWPFPRSLMVGFQATASSMSPPQEQQQQQQQSSNNNLHLPPIVVDPAELEDAQWFSKHFIKANGLIEGKGSSALDFVPDEEESAFHVPGPASLARLLISKWVMEDE